MRPGAVLADPEAGHVDDVVDLDRYPIDQPASATPWRDLTAHVHTELAADGAVRLPGFLRPAALAIMATDIAKRAVYVPIREQRASVYASSCSEAADDSAGGNVGATASPDPRHRELTWVAGHVTRDMIPAYTDAHRLYVSAAFKRFVAAVVGAERVYEYADPLAGLVATVLPPGGAYPWHYDTNEFVLTIVLQQGDVGGAFEYYRDLRRPGDENLDGLGEVLAGTAPPPRSSRCAPGDLSIFRGRYSLHQVTPVAGTRNRHTLVLSYADRPGVIGPLERTRSVYGRVTEQHLMAASKSIGADGLIL
ncbi:MAG: HalD/BesD family halogenase [Acidimicrobiales bacterium]